MNWKIFRLNKGVIVYICDSRGVRDIYDVEGTNAVAASEPLAVLVIFFPSIMFLMILMNVLSVSQFPSSRSSFKASQQSTWLGCMQDVPFDS